MRINKKILDLSNLNGSVLIFGGPYSNLQATRAMYEKSMEIGISPDHVICTGDTVAYCGQPEETVNLIRQWGCHVVMGNCEESVGNDLSDCGCGFEQGSVCATLSVDWYRHTLAAMRWDNKAWMQQLPTRIDFTLSGKSFSVIHGGIDNFSEFVFLSSNDWIKINSLDAINVDCIIGGHCGIPFGQKLDNGYWLNAGVIGMPANDGSTSTWYMLLQSDKNTVHTSWHRLEFNHIETARMMEKYGLPDDYQRSLQTGIWPSMSILPAKEQSNRSVRIPEQSLTLI